MNPNRLLLISLFVMALSNLLSTEALCGDGVIEINMARAKAGGVTATDTPGFPVILDQPGSYRLTGNLDLRNEPAARNAIAIRVDADDVTIDLNEFEIIGVVTCPDGPSSCTPANGVGMGVWGSAQTANNLTVRNGAIRGMGRRAVQVNTGLGARIENVRIFETWDNGLELRDHGWIRGNHFALNRNLGINTHTGSLVVGNTFEANGAIAARVIFGFVVGNYISGNDGYGISQFTPYAGNILDGNNGSGDQVENSFDMCNNISNDIFGCP